MQKTLMSVAVVGIVVAAASVGFSQTKPSTASIKGVWQGVSTVVTGPNAASNPKRQPNMVIYTEKHFCQIAQDGAAPQPPRKPIPPPKDAAKLTDSEKIALYELWRPLGLQCGTYTVKGNTYTQQPIITKAPPEKGTTYPENVPNEFRNVPNEFRLEGNNNTLVQIGRSADGKTVTTRTYTRLE
jgi:hypothetical protein